MNVNLNNEFFFTFLIILFITIFIKLKNNKLLEKNIKNNIENNIENNVNNDLLMEIKKQNKKYELLNDNIEDLNFVFNNVEEQTNIINDLISKINNLIKSHELKISDVEKENSNLKKYFISIQNIVNNQNIKFENYYKSLSNIIENENKKYSHINDKLIDIDENLINNLKKENKCNEIENMLIDENKKTKEEIKILKSKIDKQIKIIPSHLDFFNFIDFNCSIIEFVVIKNKIFCLFDNYNFNYPLITFSRDPNAINYKYFENINFINVTNFGDKNLKMFFFQFKNIKNVYFNFSNENIPINFTIDFIFDILENIDIYLTFNNYEENENNIQFINKITMFNNYKSINIKIKNNNLLNYESIDKLKKHCNNNNIIFSLN